MKRKWFFLMALGMGQVGVAAPLTLEEVQNLFVEPNRIVESKHFPEILAVIEKFYDSEKQRIPNFEEDGSNDWRMYAFGWLYKQIQGDIPKQQALLRTLARAVDEDCSERNRRIAVELLGYPEYRIEEVRDFLIRFVQRESFIRSAVREEALLSLARHAANATGGTRRQLIQLFESSVSDVDKNLDLASVRALERVGLEDDLARAALIKISNNKGKIYSSDAMREASEVLHSKRNSQHCGVLSANLLGLPNQD